MITVNTKEGGRLTLTNHELDSRCSLTNHDLSSRCSLTNHKLNARYSKPRARRDWFKGRQHKEEIIYCHEVPSLLAKSPIQSRHAMGKTSAISKIRVLSHNPSSQSTSQHARRGYIGQPQPQNRGCLPPEESVSSSTTFPGQPQPLANIQ